MRIFVGSLARTLAGCTLGGAVGLSIAEWWPYPATLAVVDTAAIVPIWIGVIVGICWSKAYSDRAPR